MYILFDNTNIVTVIYYCYFEGINKAFRILYAIMDMSSPSEFDEYSDSIEYASEDK